MESSIYYFEDGGEKNTDTLLELAKKRAVEREITHVVVASNTGNTGVRAAIKFRDTEINVVVVTRQTGRRDPGVQELTEENRKKLEDLGVKIVTCTEAFRGIGDSLAWWPPPSEFQQQAPSLPSYIPPMGETIRRVLRLFSSGIMVCFEITVMAADAGAIPLDKNIVVIAGTHRGADTAMLLKPAHSNNFFNIDANEIIAKPYSKRRRR